MKKTTLLAFTLLLVMVYLNSSCKKTAYIDSALLNYTWRFDSIGAINTCNYQKDTMGNTCYLTCNFVEYQNQIAFSYCLGIFGNGTYQYDQEHHLTCQNEKRWDKVGGFKDPLWVNIYMDAVNHSNSYFITGDQLTIYCYNNTKAARFTKL